MPEFHWPVNPNLERIGTRRVHRPLTCSVTAPAVCAFVVTFPAFSVGFHICAFVIAVLESPTPRCAEQSMLLGTQRFCPVWRSKLRRRSFSSFRSASPGPVVHRRTALRVVGVRCCSFFLSRAGGNRRLSLVSGSNGRRDHGRIDSRASTRSSFGSTFHAPHKTRNHSHTTEAAKEKKGSKLVFRGSAGRDRVWGSV